LAAEAANHRAGQRQAAGAGMRGAQPNLEASGFQSPLPASTMVEVTKMTSPEYLIEMSAIAVIPDSKSLP